MKTIYFLITFVIVGLFANSQVPPLAFNYQGVARSNQGNFIPNQDIAIRFTIMEGSTTGTIIYIEEHTSTTNNFGLFSVAIGRGIPTQGTFAAINWATGTKFLKVEIDPSNKKNYILQGTTQFLSVPYALFAGKVNLIAGDGIKISNDTISFVGNVTAGPWKPDQYGIYYNQGNVGIGGDSRSDASLSVSAGSALPWATDITSLNDWQTSVNVRNSTNSRWFALVVGGINNTQPNYGVGEGNFGIVNANTTGLNTTIPLIITKDDKVGIGGNYGGNEFLPKSKLHVRNGDVYIDQIDSGVIMKSPNGQCWRMTVSDLGAPVFTAIACPN